MPPDQRSDIGATASTTPKSTKMLLEPVRLLKLTQTTDVASGYILDGLTVQSKVTFLNGLTRHTGNKKRSALESRFAFLSRNSSRFALTAERSDSASNSCRRILSQVACK